MVTISPVAAVPELISVAAAVVEVAVAYVVFTVAAVRRSSRSTAVPSSAGAGNTYAVVAVVVSKLVHQS